MMPAPKATSQGSKAGGGGAFRALTGMSAAKAEPVTIASAVANKATFFISIPITSSTQSVSRKPPGRTTCLQNFVTATIWMGGCEP
jgi:hypothetical protein